jgi:TIR domain
MTGRQRGRMHTHDVFIAHASEDKDEVARPLVEALQQRGWSAWLDELEMTVGDSLTLRIDQALLQSRFGVVILSPKFFSKRWTKRELVGLTAREVQSGTKVILPVWHNLDSAEVAEFSPTLADRVGVSTAAGVDEVADQLSHALAVAQDRSPVPGKQPLVQGLPVASARRRMHRASRFVGRSYAMKAVLIAAVLASIATLLLALLFPTQSSSVTSREFHLDGASIAISKPARIVGVSMADRRLGLTKAIRSRAATIVLGAVAGNELPVPIPPIPSLNVRLPAGQALRSDGVSSLHAGRMFTFHYGGRYLLIICRPTEGTSLQGLRRDCNRVARSVNLPRPATAIAYPTASVRREVKRSLRRYAEGRRAAAEAIAKAATAEDVAVAAAQAAHSAMTAAEAVHAAELMNIRRGLLEAERAWRAASKAARDEADGAYDKAGEEVEGAERQIRKARHRLLALGYRA